ncbi:MAG: hypothetical protein H6705_08290 [Myxococcales bacterium]|nr:hypothetical protein [Myxococcales bacterium]
MHPSDTELETSRARADGPLGDPAAAAPSPSATPAPAAPNPRRPAQEPHRPLRAHRHRRRRAPHRRPRRPQPPHRRARARPHPRPPLPAADATAPDATAPTPPRPPTPPPRRRPPRRRRLPTVTITIAPVPADIIRLADGATICAATRECALPIDVDYEARAPGHKPRPISGDDLYDRRRSGHMRVVLEPADRPARKKR